MNYLAEINEVVFLFARHCHFDDAFYDLFVWCDEHDCSFEYIGQALLKKVFQVTTVGNDLVQLIKGNHPERSDYVETEEYWAKISVAFGKLLRWSLDFDPKEIP